MTMKFLCVAGALATAASFTTSPAAAPFLLLIVLAGFRICRTKERVKQSSILIVVITLCFLQLIKFKHLMVVDRRHMLPQWDKHFRGGQEINADMAVIQNQSFVVSKQEAELLCDETNEIVKTVYHRALLNSTEALLWEQKGPFVLLTCEQLIRSLPTVEIEGNVSVGNNNVVDSNITAVGGRQFELDHSISLQRLSEKLNMLGRKPFNTLTIAVIGGSMSTGYVDGGRFNNDTYNLAWPRKLEQFMHQKWHESRLKVINLAIGGADENTHLGRLDLVTQHKPDIILVESAVNDQCDYGEQDTMADFVNQTSDTLLNILMNFPQKPAVISVELFRTAYRNMKDANRHCKGNVGSTSDPSCFYCPQWWKPQSWRKDARDRNSVSHASFRDAVWPIQSKPPDELCHSYWSGLSHPEAGVHAIVASTILYQFMTVMQHREAFVQYSRRGEEMMVELKQANIPKDLCLDHISSFRAMQGNPNDPFNSTFTGGRRGNDGKSCWEFRADVPQKYGWICEESQNRTIMGTNRVVNRSDLGQNDSESHHQEDHVLFSKRVNIGGERKVIISRLVSYDERMAIAQVWFSKSNSKLSDISGQTNNNVHNIFVGDPVWNITSWNPKLVSIPQPYGIQLNGLDLKKLPNLQWSRNNTTRTRGEKSDDLLSILDVTINLKLLVGSSKSSQKEERTGVDKFKLLGIVTC